MVGEIMVSYGDNIDETVDPVSQKKSDRQIQPPGEVPAFLTAAHVLRLLGVFPPAGDSSLSMTLDNRVPDSVRLSRPDGAELDDVFRIEIGQLQPVFGNIRR